MLKCHVCNEKLEYSGRGRKPKYCSNACKMKHRRDNEKVSKSNEKKTLIKNITQQIKSPALRYYGGKFNLSSWIIEHFPPHECYVEPFGGAASVLLRKLPAAHEVYNDLNSDVVNFFQVLRTRRDDLLEQLLLTPYSQEEHAKAWDYHPDDVERARRFYVRSWCSFGSGTDKDAKATGFRTTKQGTSSALRTFNNLDSLVTTAARLKHTQIVNAPAEDTMKRFDTLDTLHYIDPPYTHAERSNTSGYRYEMDNSQHEHLAECVHELKGMIVLSGYDSDLYRQLYQGWDMVTKDTRDLVAKKRTECLWLSPGVYEKIKLPMFAS